MNAVWTIKIDGTRGTARVDIGSCSNRAQASRRRTNGANALNVVRDILAKEDVNKRVAFRLFVDAEELVILMFLDGKILRVAVLASGI